MNKPTQEQVKEFWERYGFTFKPFAPQYDVLDELGNYFIYAPNGELSSLDEDPDTNLPFINLDNLFEYAVPKLWVDLCGVGESYKIDRIWESIKRALLDKTSVDLAVFWTVRALWQMREERSDQ